MFPWRGAARSANFPENHSARPLCRPNPIPETPESKGLGEYGFPSASFAPIMRFRYTQGQMSLAVDFFQPAICASIRAARKYRGGVIRAGEGDCQAVVRGTIELRHLRRVHLVGHGRVHQHQIMIAQRSANGELRHWQIGRIFLSGAALLRRTQRFSLRLSMRSDSTTPVKCARQD